MNFILKLVKIRFQILSFFAPKTAAKKAIELFQKPHFNKIREREKDFLRNANILRISYKPEDIILYETGDKSGKPILMVHGWDSNPGSMAGIAKELANKGFHIFSLNVPAHGISEQKGTNMLIVSKMIMLILKKLDKYGQVSMITHSFGSGAVSFALEQCQKKADKIVFITSPDRLWDIFKDFQLLIGLNKRAFDYMIKMTEERFGKTFDDLQVSKALLNANFNKLLLIHDKHDKILPFENVKRIHEAIKNSKLLATEGKGHYRILWDDSVIREIGQFMTST